MWLKTLLLILFIYWISQRVFRIFNAVGQDRGQGPHQAPRGEGPSSKPDQIIPDDKGEYIDYEELD